MVVGIFRSDARDQFALIRVPCHEGKTTTLEWFQSAILRIEPQLSLAVTGIGTVAMVAIVRKDRLDIAAEIDFIGRWNGPHRG